MAINIEVKRNENVILPAWPDYLITDFSYPKWDDEEVTECGPVGSILPKGKGFSFKMEPPSLSFKCYRAMVSQGLSSLANHVITHYRRSVITPNNVWNGVMKFSHKLPKRIKHQYYDEALERVKQQLGHEKFIPYSMDAGVDTLPKNTSPGLPYITQLQGAKKIDIYNRFSPAFKGYWTRVGKGLPVTPIPDCAAFARSHISAPDKNKVRPVWAYPMLAITQESRFASPIIARLVEQECGWNTAYGCEMMKGGMTWLNNQASIASARDPGVKFLMTDFSGFDQSVPAWLIRDVFRVIEEKIDFSKEQHNGTVYDVDSDENRRKFRKCVNYFINTPIRNCDGRRYQKASGVPSGSMFTNIIDTFVNMVISTVLMRLHCDRMPVFDIYFGDDGLICMDSDSKIDIRLLGKAAKDLFGMSLNVDKTYYTTTLRNIHFLGYYNYFGAPYKKSPELIASLLYPQYLQDDWAYCVSRALGCALASAGMSIDVYLAAQAVFIFATRREDKFEQGMDLLRSNPRAYRHLQQMGCGDLPLNESYFRDINALLPRLDCKKIQRNIQL